VVFHERGLPPPELQVTIFGQDGSKVARVDFFWREYGVVAEADGLLKYQSGADAIAELERDRLLREQGLEVIHFTWQELFSEPEHVMRRTLAAFERARRLRRPPT
jgi:very-short-patch-repair endonuclease